MIHTSEQALEAACEILDRYEIKHIGIGTPKPKAGFGHQTDPPVMDVWVVDYSYMVFRKMMLLFI